MRVIQIIAEIELFELAHAPSRHFRFQHIICAAQMCMTGHDWRSSVTEISMR